MALSHSSFGALSADGERRGAARHNLIDAYMATATLGDSGSALILDVSETGLGLQAVGVLTVGAVTPLRFTLPQGRVIEANGTVAWTDETGRTGIRLFSFGAGSKLSLTQWIACTRDNPAAAFADPAPDPVVEAVDYIASRKPALDAALAFIAEKAALNTRADGAALALQDDSGMVCRASVGTAPGVGVRLQGGSGLTGECIRTASVVRCEDTEVDPRADRLLCRRINLRSTVIVPVISSGAVIGVLETLSARPRAFDNDHVRILRGLAELVSANVRPAVLPPRAPARLMDPPAAVMAPPAPAPTAPRPPAPPARTAAAAAPAMAPLPAVQPKPALNSAATRPIPLPDSPQPAAAAPLTKSVPQAMYARARRVPKAAMLAIAGGAFALAIGGLYLEFHQSPVGVAVVHASAPPAAAEPNAASANAPASASVTPTQLVLPPATATAKPASSQPAASEKKQPSAPEAPGQIALREPSDVSVVQKQADSLVPPTLELAALSAPSLPKPSTAMPEVQPKVSGGITEAKLVHRVDPVYPAVARQMHVEGSVQIQAVVAQNGMIKNPVVVSGPTLLRTAALEAVRKWHYEPSRLDGQPTDRDLLITITFHLPK